MCLKEIIQGVYGYEKKIIVIGGFCCLALASALVFKNLNYIKADSSAQTPKIEEELFPEKEVPKEYEEDNLYVQMNNKLVKAMNDYEKGEITEEEYNAICKEISTVVSDKDNLKRMEKEEDEFNKQEVGK